MTEVKAYVGNEPYIFVSYSHQDTCVIDIIKEITANGYRIWYDEGIESGGDWADEIIDRLKNACQFVVFLSESAIASKNVKDEIHIAIKYNLNIQIIYLEEITLQGGLELHLDRIQAIHRRKYSTETGFYKKLISALEQSTSSNTDQTEEPMRNLLEEQYEKITELSTSPFVNTYRGISKKNGLPVFIKRFLVNNTITGEEIKLSAKEEISILKEMQIKCCPYVPKLIDTIYEKNTIYIIEQFINGKSLTEYIYHFHGGMHHIEDQCISIVKKIAQALLYLHNASSPIVHRDIKPQNIIVTAYGDVFLVDFDCCIRINTAIPYHYTCLGTKGYAAPEQYSNASIPDQRSDIYSLGILFLQMLTKVSPPSLYINNGQNDSIAPARYFNKEIDPFLENILLKMTATDKNERFSDTNELIHALKQYETTKTLARRKAMRQSNKRLKTFQKTNKREERKNETYIPFPVPSPISRVFDSFEQDYTPTTAPLLNMHQHDETRFFSAENNYNQEDSVTVTLTMPL